MKHEFHAHYPLALQDSVTQAKTIDWLVGKSDWLPPAWRELPKAQDEEARISLLAQTVITDYKEQARMGTRGEAGGFGYWLERRAASFLQAQLRFLDELGLFPTFPDLPTLPAGSWALHFTFTLRKPYLSRDDTDWHILDNPVKKEWVFKLPYVAPTQWKGALRSAMIQQLVEQLNTTGHQTSFIEKRLQLYRLFGNEKDGTADFLNRAWARQRVGPRPDDGAQHEAWQRQFRQALDEVVGEWEHKLRQAGYRQGDVEGFQGRLYFYPTYFYQIGLEVINPHPRDTGAGKQPIYFECVPAGAQGTFTLLYVPLDGADQTTDDPAAVAEGIQAMMTVYGFGAKTSSGYGLAEEEFARDEQGKPQAIIRLKDGKSFRCRSFAGLPQAAQKLAEELSHAS